MSSSQVLDVAKMQLFGLQLGVLHDRRNPQPQLCTMVTMNIKHKDGSTTGVLLDDDSPYLNRPFYLSRGYVQMRHNGKTQYLHRAGSYWDSIRAIDGTETTRIGTNSIICHATFESLTLAKIAVIVGRTPPTRLGSLECARGRQMGSTQQAYKGGRKATIRSNG